MEQWMMDGWMDRYGWIDKQMMDRYDGWMDWMDGWIDMDGWMDDGWMDMMDGWI